MSYNCILNQINSITRNCKKAVAVIANERKYTYHEIDKLSCKIENTLNGYNASGTPVLVVSQPSAFLYAAIIALVRLNCPYIPISKKYPVSLIQKIQKESAAELVLKESLTTSGYEVTYSPNEDKYNHDFRNIFSILYTSGSTGEPKGVQIPYTALYNRFQWMWEEFPYSKNEVQLFKSDPIFVDSIWEMLGGFLKGMKTVTLPHIESAEALLKIVQKHSISRITLVPSLLNTILAAVEEDKFITSTESVRYWLISGEVFAQKLAKKLFELTQDQSIILNLYGSTEVMGDVLFHQVSMSSFKKNAIPIGTLIPNTNAILIDNHCRVSNSNSGILAVSGTNVSTGYINTSQNDMSFKQIKLPNEELCRFFVTDDICELSDGEYHFIGRSSRDIKIKGIKVNLTCIEQEISSIEEIRECAIVEHNQNIFCFYSKTLATFKDREINRIIIEYLENKFPPYVLPSVFQSIANLPKTISGKINYQELVKYCNKENHNAPSSCNKLVNVIAPIIGNNTFRSDESLFECGLNSLNSIQVISEIRRKLNKKISLKELYRNPTINAIHSILEKL